MFIRKLLQALLRQAQSADHRPAGAHAAQYWHGGARGGDGGAGHQDEEGVQPGRRGAQQQEQALQQRNVSCGPN